MAEESYRRTNEPVGQEIAGSTAGASGGRDLECPAGYFIRTGESTYHTLACSLPAGHDGMHYDGFDKLLWMRPVAIARSGRTGNVISAH